MEYKDFKRKQEKGARVTIMSSAFDAFVDGSDGKPFDDPTGKKNYLLGDSENIAFLNASMKYTSDFALHAAASIPYLAEGDCRLGAAILRYAKEKNCPLSLQEIAGANGAFSKTLVDLSKGKISTLTNSATHGNYLEFLKIRPEGSYFWDGPFYEITPQILKKGELTIFEKGFDIIYEHVVFQMYSANRAEQIEFVSQNLKSDGILVLLEKNSQLDIEEYLRRELKKDDDFKSKYFSETQLKEKREKILNTMESGQITLDELTSAISIQFKFSLNVWNSCNFNLVIASNNQNNLEKFVSHMTYPCMPDDFCFEEIPQILLGKQNIAKVEFRTSNSN